MEYTTIKWTQPEKESSLRWRSYKKEHMAVEALVELIAKGQVAICANKKHTCLNSGGKCHAPN